MNIRIFNSNGSTLLHSGDFASILDAQTDAVRKGINLKGATVNGMPIGTAIQLEQGEPAFPSVQELIQNGKKEL